jgi:Zn-dependent protease
MPMLNLLGTDPLIFVANALVMVIAFTIHEFSHAWSATLFGDNTPRAYGRLTLNPLVHLDLMGSLLLIVAGFGWAKPVPINPYSMRPRSGVMWVSLAGPMSNFLMAALAIIPLRFHWIPQSWYAEGTFFGVFLTQFIFINLSLMLFNLIPIAPLDGEKIAMYVWPPSWSAGLEQVSRFGPYILLGLMLLGQVGGVNILQTIIGGPMLNLYYMMMGGSPILFN